MIERSHLAILREVDRRGSLTAAAEELCLTQSALSHAIRKLEGQLGTEVWEKDGRGLKLTAAGEHLLSVAKRLLPQFEQAESVLEQIARGQNGTLRIGIECHPCHRWLLKVVGPYLEQWPAVDVDVKRKFQFGGLRALFAHEIDVLVTPDPLLKPGLKYEAVLDYEHVLVVGEKHRLASRECVNPEDLIEEVLITYPVDLGRLDIYTDFLLPADCRPKKHKCIEDTEIMLQMVASGRGVAALPRWLVDEQAQRLPLRGLSLAGGLQKQIFLGFRTEGGSLPYVEAFIRIARELNTQRVKKTPNSLPDPGSSSA